MDITILAIALVTGLVEVIKRAFNLKTRYAPLVSVLFGLLVSFLFVQANISDTIIAGIVIGLSACGLYSGTKTSLKK